MDPTSQENRPVGNPNQNNPNPYLRRYGSHVKSHFSQSRCEFFESSDEEDSKIKSKDNRNNVNSLEHINDIKIEANNKGNQSASHMGPAKGKDINQVKEEFFTTSTNGNMGKSPSIDSNCSNSNDKTPQENLPLPEVNVPDINVNGESTNEMKTLNRKDSLEMELDEMDDDEDRKSALIIKSRRDSVSQDSFDEGGDKVKPEALFVNKHFKNGEVVEEKKEESNTLKVQ